MRRIGMGMAAEAFAGVKAGAAGVAGVGAWSEFAVVGAGDGGVTRGELAGVAEDEGGTVGDISPVVVAVGGPAGVAGDGGCGVFELAAADGVVDVAAGAAGVETGGAGAAAGGLSRAGGESSRLRSGRVRRAK
jgi:hypothetical protein